MNRALLLVLCVACAGLSRQNPLESNDVLARQEVSPQVQVKHVLIGWSWLASSYRKMGMTLDDRAQGRNETAADELAQKLLAQCRAGNPPFEALMRQYSEDGGSAQSAIAYPVDESSKFTQSFKELAMRLKPGECGMVRSEFGWHVMKRVA